MRKVVKGFLAAALLACGKAAIIFASGLATAACNEPCDEIVAQWNTGQSFMEEYHSRKMAGTLTDEENALYNRYASESNQLADDIDAHGCQLSQ